MPNIHNEQPTIPQMLRICTNMSARTLFRNINNHVSLLHAKISKFIIVVSTKGLSHSLLVLPTQASFPIFVHLLFALSFPVQDSALRLVQVKRLLPATIPSISALNTKDCCPGAIIPRSSKESRNLIILFLSIVLIYFGLTINLHPKMEDNEFPLTVFSYFILRISQIYSYFSIPTSFFFIKKQQAPQIKDIYCTESEKCASSCYIRSEKEFPKCPLASLIFFLPKR